MTAVKNKLKEMIFECETEAEAMELLKSYRKKNFHLVSKKITNFDNSTVALKLVKFRQPSNEKDLETVWESFVSQMVDLDIEAEFISEVLNRIRSKKDFWEVHPQDHLRDIVMDAKNFAKQDEISKVLVFVAEDQKLLDIFSVYQRTLGAVIKNFGAFVIMPKRLKASVTSLKTTTQMQVLSYQEKTEFSKFQKDIDLKFGLILVSPRDIDFIKDSTFSNSVKESKVSLILDSNQASKFSESFSFQKFIFADYSSAVAYKQIFSAMNLSLKHNLKLAFLWNKDSASSFLNIEAQVLKSIDDIFEIEMKQQFGN